MSFDLALAFIPYIGDMIGGAIMFLQFAILILAASLFDFGDGQPVGESLMQLIRERGGILIGLAVLIIAIIIFIGIALAISSAISGISQQIIMLVILLVSLLLFFLLGFAPALIAFNDIDLWETVEASAIGMLKNIAPFITLFIIFIFISIVFGGLLLSSDIIPDNLQQGDWSKLIATSPIASVILVILSVMMTAFSAAIGYVSYRDVFGSPENINKTELHSEQVSLDAENDNQY